MLRFFRSIRQQLLLRREGYAGHVAENKTVKYFKYAIGEVLLIMVGIIMALQLNNWNEGRKDRVLGKEYVARLLQDLQTDIETMQQAIRTGERKVESLQAILQILRDPSMVEKNPTAAKPSTTYSYQRPALQTTIFQELTSTGSLRLIEDEQIRFKVGNHYSEVLADFDRLDERRTQLASMVKEIFPDAFKEASTDTEAFFSESHVEERLKLLLSREYQGMVLQELYYSRRIIGISSSILTRTEKLIADLEAYQGTLN